ncbi:hypothetical protein L596_017696 [Steinernema carpocapsae]|uniref:Uncharacterized protein n=1 Tax=Steinernema carpocapsae TaxID=34508 RepID=A0A4U5N2R3_STECR|nr:hypothetical protein L596_017696 [Steinernema carpocapsae]
MNQLPFSFYEDVLSNASATHAQPNMFNPEYTRLSGRLGAAARAFDEKRYYTSVELRDGKISQVHFHDCAFSRLSKEERPKRFKQRKFIVYHQNLAFPISSKVERRLEHYAREPGMLSLGLNNNVLSDKWIQLFTSWKNLQMLIIAVPMSEPILTLIRDLLSQKQLLYLRNHSSNYGIPGIFLFCQLLKQDQFLVFRLRSEMDELLKQQILHIWSRNKDLLTGKMVSWDCEQATMPSGCFGIPEHVGNGVMRFENENFVVEHYNSRGTIDMSDEEFMKGVNCTDWRFK